jgi:hypothetical protein
MLAFSDQELRKVDRWLIDAGETKRHPEAETRLVTGDNLAGVTRRVLNQLWEAVI